MLAKHVLKKDQKTVPLAFGSDVLFNKILLIYKNLVKFCFTVVYSLN